MFRLIRETIGSMARLWAKMMKQRGRVRVSESAVKSFGLTHRMDAEVCRIPENPSAIAGGEPHCIPSLPMESIHPTTVCLAFSSFLLLVSVITC